MKLLHNLVVILPVFCCLASCSNGSNNNSNSTQLNLNSIYSANVAGDIYQGNNRISNQFGGPLFNNPAITQVKINAVDRSVYFVNNMGSVYKYSSNQITPQIQSSDAPDGSYITSRTFDNNGNLYVTTSGPIAVPGSVYKITESGYTQLGGGTVPNTSLNPEYATPIILIVTDKNNNLYVATNDGHIYKVTSSSYIALGGNMPDPNNSRISSMYIDNNDNLYAANNDGYVYNVSASNWIALANNTPNPNYSEITVMSTDNTGILYAANDDGYVYKINTSSWLDVGDSPDHSPITSMAFDSKNNLYVATKGPTAVAGNIYKFTEPDWTQIGSSPNYPFIGDRQPGIDSITFDINDNLFLGTSNGNLYEIVDNTATWKILTTTPTLDGSAVNTIQFDQNKNLYAGTQNGNIFRYSANNWQLFGAESSPDHSAVNSIAIDHNGNLYVATVGPMGISGSVYKVTESAWQQIGGGPAPNNGKDPTQYGPSVTSVILDKANNVYAATGSGYVYQVTTNSWTTLGGGSSSPDGSAVATIITDSNSNIYVGTRGPRAVPGSIYQVTRSNWIQLGDSSKEIEAQYGASIKSLTLDKNNNLFAGTSAGYIYRITPTNWINIVANNSDELFGGITSMMFDNDSNLYFATNRGNVYQLPQSGSIIKLGLSNDASYPITSIAITQ